MKPIRWHDDKNKFSIDHLWALMEVGIMPDTDYMRVPRCDRCRHWSPDGTGDRGDCDLAVLGVSNFEVYSDDRAGLETSADFGCVQWEAK